MTVPTSSGEAAAWRWAANRKPVPGGSVLGDADLLVSFRKPVVCGVSSLGIDHTSLLGDTVEKIAWQKGGIFKVTAGHAERFTGARSQPSVQSGFALLSLYDLSPSLASAEIRPS